MIAVSDVYCSVEVNLDESDFSLILLTLVSISSHYVKSNSLCISISISIHVIVFPL